MTEQIKQLARVEGRIAHRVRAYLAIVGPGAEFHAENLQRFVCSKVQCSPSSPDRILRGLKRDGLVKYEVVNRAQSLYRFDGFCEPESKPVYSQGRLF